MNKSKTNSNDGREFVITTVNNVPTDELQTVGHHFTRQKVALRSHSNATSLSKKGVHQLRKGVSVIAEWRGNGNN